MSSQGLDLYAYLILAVFLLGYVFIALESVIRVNKATSALLMGIISWVIVFSNQEITHHNKELIFGGHLAEITQVVLFLVGALTIVEIINTHGGFRIISDFIRFRSKRITLWVVALVSFFLSAILDNVTTTIVMVALVSKIATKSDDRWILGSGVVIAANAGGVWSPIGDITTTMLWLGEQVTVGNVIKTLFLPSFVCACVSIFCLQFYLKGDFPFYRSANDLVPKEPLGTFILILGCVSLISIPIFKVYSGLPPFMGILLAMSILWLVTDLLHHRFEERQHLRVQNILTKVDYSGAIFFLGTLLAIDAMAAAGLLQKTAEFLHHYLLNDTLIALFVGFLSAIIDNVPLVAATMGMYQSAEYVVNPNFWQLIAYAAGVGGSLLIIGSAAGIAFMGMEKVRIGWYLKRVSLSALAGYISGFFVYLWTV